MPLDRKQIVDEAMALLDAEGLENVTLRKLAARLGVQAPTLYWHLPNKAALITAIAEEVLTPSPAVPLVPGERWQDWLITLAERLRTALLAHPDGARVVSIAQLSQNMAAVSELAMKTLVEQGLSLHRARVTVLTVERFTIGYALEEQAPRPDPKDFDLAAFTEAYPTVIAGITEYFTPGRTAADLFHECVTLVVEGPG
ncbi:TetR/AcrR family tetracycline transcriptional repressor [Actinoplanes tereljensis]|uniref:TetR family transcriptional regulator n=1 Tax=Paractinoplanes tereljensis TaxID=571912 RepID=A0A919NG32_9ACTN|nr:TetR/AcrR family transcriptional regulator C-terminal domain-containing protein [Actinoplanes tereljensis]GIF17474.1 TetR family transcriptional regulator [Actinoplanes tereljensis]